MTQNNKLYISSKPVFDLIKECAIQFEERLDINESEFDSSVCSLEITKGMYFLRFTHKINENFISIEYTGQDFNPLKANFTWSSNVWDNKTFYGVIKKLILRDGKCYYLDPELFSDVRPSPDFSVNSNFIKTKLFAHIFKF